MPLDTKQIFALRQLASQPNGAMRAFAFLTDLDHSVASAQDLLKKGLISLVESPGDGVMITQLGRDALGLGTIKSDDGV
ncbi:hypothetical protein UP10_34480 [Bradyrhizobium sp. LTSPM299]|uniref:MarR family transcriptional regulator n=1 Tax=Bradyrhizobium sp. LTSPM299 TaxID=1619233 RepID=UPI0005C86883|nr:helix-turn-helix domain-containing protein [Bradyrhizobium sp. LTSPM299]KJC56393.1 hypothetical protein UP10_34480 [Bradyrhizobium sp. LTSPM299]